MAFMQAARDCPELANLLTCLVLRDHRITRDQQFQSSQTHLRTICGPFVDYGSSVRYADRRVGTSKADHEFRGVGCAESLGKRVLASTRTKRSVQDQFHD